MRYFGFLGTCMGLVAIGLTFTGNRPAGALVTGLAFIILWIGFVGWLYSTSSRIDTLEKELRALKETL